MRKTNLIKTLAIAIPFAFALSGCTSSSSDTVESTTEATTTTAKETTTAEATTADVTTEKKTTTVAETTTVKETTVEDTTEETTELEVADETTEEKESEIDESKEPTGTSSELTSTENPDETAIEDLDILTRLYYFIQTGDSEYLDLANLTAEEKKAIKDAISAEEGTVEFLEDGSMVLTNGDKYNITITPDGAMFGTDEDGQEISVQRGNKWPETVLTKLVPKPDFDIKSATADNNGQTLVYFDNVTIDDIKAYAKEIMAAGFECEEMDYSEYGMYGIEGTNADGVSVILYISISEEVSECLFTISYESLE